MRIVTRIAATAVLIHVLIDRGACQTPGSPLSVKRVVAFEYPPFARMADLQGRVELVASITPDGSVGEVEVMSGAEPLATPAKTNLKKWRFNACESKENACKVRVVFSYILSGKCSPSTQCPTEFVADLPDRVEVKSKTFDSLIPEGGKTSHQNSSK